MAALATPWVGATRAATDDDLAFAYFGLSGELLLADFYAKALAAGKFPKDERAMLRDGRTNAAWHAKALSDQLAGAGADVPTAEDFAFQWPKAVYTEPAKTVETGLTIVGALQAAYQTGATTSSEPTYRVLYASLAASNAQQFGLLRAMSGHPVAEPFPVALDLEDASDAIESYLG